MAILNKGRALRVALVLAFSGTTLLASAQSKQSIPAMSAQQIVDQFFPGSIAAGSGSHPAPWELKNRFEAFVVIEKLPDGSPKTIVAAYTNGGDGAVRVIQIQSDESYKVVFEPTGLDLGGTSVAVRLWDVDQTGIPAVEVSFGTFRAQTADWIFRWDGTKLINLTPTEDAGYGLKDTVLVLTKFADLNHDGTLEVISELDYPPQEKAGELPVAAEEIYRLTPSGYVFDRPVLYVSSFFRHPGAPRKETEQFSLLKKSVGPYLLKVVNGDKDGSNRVTSAHIVLNGIEVAGPNLFNQQVEFLSVPVNPQAQNKVEVTLEGKPGSKIIVTVEDQGAQQ
jgi:hypothetical protein